MFKYVVIIDEPIARAYRCNRRREAERYAKREANRTGFVAVICERINYYAPG